MDLGEWRFIYTIPEEKQEWSERRSGLNCGGWQREGRLILDSEMEVNGGNDDDDVDDEVEEGKNAT